MATKTKKIECRRVRPGRTLTWPDLTLRGVGGVYNVRIDDPFLKGFEHVLESATNFDPPNEVEKRPYAKQWAELPEETPKPEKAKAAPSGGGKSGGKGPAKGAPKKGPKNSGKPEETDDTAAAGGDDDIPDADE